MTAETKPDNEFTAVCSHCGRTYATFGEPNPNVRIPYFRCYCETPLVSILRRLNTEPEKEGAA